MSERGLPVAESSAPACPFVAFEDERDERSSRPDHRHRCYAELRPAPRALAHQEAFCLASAFPACPTFQDWARREAARERHQASPAIDDTPVDPFGDRSPQRRPWAAPPPWLESDGSNAADAGSRDDEREAPARADTRQGARGSEVVAAPEFLDRRSTRPQDASSGSEAPEANRPPGRQPGRGLADVDPERPWLPVTGERDPSRSADADYAASPGRDTATRDAGRDGGVRVGDGRDGGRGGDRDDAELRARSWRREGLEADDNDADDEGPDGEASWAPARGRDERGAGLLGGVAAGIGDALGRDRRPRVGDARRTGSASYQAGHAATRVSSQARMDDTPHDPSAPAWERPRRMEAYPTLKTRVGLPSMPPVALGFGALLIAALAFFLIPIVLLSHSPSNTGDVVPTPTPSLGASPSEAATPSLAPTPVSYTVKPGDTLSAIAKKLGVSLDALLAANPQIKDPNKIGLGDQINIPSKAPSEITDASPSGGSSPSP